MSPGRSRRGKRDVEHLQAVEKVFAKVPALHRFLQVAIRRRDHAHVRLERTRRTEPLEFSLLQHTQELRLRRRTHFRHFIEKEYATGSELDLSGLCLLRAGERPRSKPNSSDSSSCSGRAAQLSATNGPSARFEAWWMNRATTSFPVPDSPTRRTVVSVEATCVAALSTSCHCGDGPTIRPVLAASSSDSDLTRPPGGPPAVSPP